MEIPGKNKNNESTKKAHVAILPSPGMGHIIPLLEFAKQLVTVHGFHVSFLTFSSGSSPAQTQLLSSPSLPSDLEIVYLPRVEIPPSFDDEKLHLSIKLRYIVIETITKFLESTLLSLHYGLPKALIMSMFCVKATDTAKKLSVPSIMFFTGSASLLSWLLYYPTFDQSVNGDYTDLPESLRTPGCGHDLLVKDLKGGAMVRESIPNLKRYVDPDGILINTWDDIEKNTVFALRECPFYVNLKTPPIYPIGPVIRSKSNDDRDQNGLELLKWLNDQPKNSVLFVSFGSGGTLSREQIVEIAYGLEQSEQRFIWVVRKPSDLSKSGSFFNVGINDM